MNRAQRAVAIFGLASFAAPSLAQDLTDADLLLLFQNQRDAFRAAQDSGFGKTRGLTLLTVESVQATTLAPELPAPVGDDEVAVVPGQDGQVTIATAPDAPTADQTISAEPVVFGALAPELQINLNIKFPFDSATLTPDQKPVLTQMCNVMRASDIHLFRIVGHTDASGTAEYNQTLSQLRAEEVQRYLVTDCGIDPARLEALGLGEQFLSDSADPKAPVNRRVEFQALS
ncbi:MAG: OmpA family protein [Paracoccaceae bacterium]